MAKSPSPDTSTVEDRITDRTDGNDFPVPDISGDEGDLTDSTVVQSAIEVQSETDIARKKFRKRQRNEDNWVRNKRRNARQHEYINTKGKKVACKQPTLQGTLCHEKCRLKCSKKKYHRIEKPSLIASISWKPQQHRMPIYLLA